MALKKNYLKTKQICRVTFSYPANDAERVCLVGDFNAWDKQATPMKKGKSGFSCTVDLEPGREYQFRYLLNGDRWENDETADSLAETPYADARNSVIRTA